MKKEKAKDLCERLMEEHKLGKKWRFEWMNTKSVYGKCSYKLKTISLSKKYVECNDEEEVKDTILHEIAHAKCRKRGHNKYWKNWCIKLGARPVRICTTANKPK